MLIFLASIARADPFVLIGSENRIATAGVVPRAKAIVDIGLVPHISLTTTFVTSPGYGEAYIGPTWSPISNFSLGIAGGMETTDSPWRVMAYSSANLKDLHLLGVVEYGGSGPWYKAAVSYVIGPVSLGVLIQRFDGLGPRLIISHWNFEFWTAPLYDFESRTSCVLVGLNWIPTLK